jgi:hypothetical protein
MTESHDDGCRVISLTATQLALSGYRPITAPESTPSGLSRVSALVVLSGIGHPGDGFADDLGRRILKLEIPEGSERAFWRDQVEQVVSFWSSPDLIMMLDGMHDEVMAELAKIKRLIRQQSQQPDR